jgi:CubicO group peptidase (beta-lactamase class C family)
MPMLKRWTRRLFPAALALLASATLHAQPQVGPVDPDFAAVDTLMRNYIAARKFPGASLVIGYGDRIIYAQGYGWADVARQVPTSPWLEYRIASVSKPITAAMVMRLVEQGRVNLDASAWGYITPVVGTAQPADARLKQVTVRQLLTHTWGLDRSISPDPMGGWYQVGNTVVSTARDMLRYHLLRMQLNNNPGARHAYNNTGFVWLQMIAESVDGRPIEKQISEALGPEALSTGRARFGEVLPSRLTPAEPVYYDYAGAPQLPPVPGVYGAPAPSTVPRPEGSYTLVGYGGSGGYVMSPLTVVRFIQRLNGERKPTLLNAATRKLMFTEQTLADGTRYWGLGIESWNAYTPDDYVLTHTGAVLGARNGFRSTPRQPRGTMLTVMVQTNGTPAGQGAEVVDNIGSEIVDPIIFAIDRIASYKTKAEIAPDRLIAPVSATEDYFTDRLFDWAQLLFPTLFPGTPQEGVIAGYRYRYFEPTQTYLGLKEGQVYLYQPAVGPAINPLGPMAQWLPQALNDLANSVAVPGASSASATAKPTSIIRRPSTFAPVSPPPPVSPALAPFR